MAEDRNFRSNYYKKFGFRNIEEKKSIELLLKEHPLDVEKLRLFCLRFPVSAKYRLYLWKIVLGKQSLYCMYLFFKRKGGNRGMYLFFKRKGGDRGTAMLQIRSGKRDNLGTISHISQFTHIL